MVSALDLLRAEGFISMFSGASSGGTSRHSSGRNPGSRSSVSRSWRCFRGSVRLKEAEPKEAELKEAEPKEAGPGESGQATGQASVTCECGRSYKTHYIPPIHCKCGAALQFEQTEKVADVRVRRGRKSNLGAGSSSFAVKSSRLWDELHHYPISRWSGPEDAREFFRQWQAKARSVLGSSCGCWSSWCRMVFENPIDVTSSCAMFLWAWERHNQVNAKLGKPWLPLEHARRRYRSSHSFVSWDDLTKDAELLAQRILVDHPDLAGVAGSPRSGMRAATDISLRLGVRLYAASPEDGLVHLGHGARMSGGHPHGEMIPIPDGPVVIVEDSVCSGTSARRLRSHADLASLPLYAVYAASPGRDQIDGFSVMLDLPHWFEWNIWNNGHLFGVDSRTGIDWDGVLNEDCPLAFDDDGPRYVRWIRSVLPCRTPVRYRVPFIITGRREVYRGYCEEWLRRHCIECGELVMYPHSFEQRKKDVAYWKAEQVRRLGCKLFIESDPNQAAIIRVLCPEVGVLCTGQTG